MKIILINPGYSSFRSLGLSYGEPLGLAYLAAAIIQDGKHEVEILDSVGLMQNFTTVDDTLRVGLKDTVLLDMLSRKKFDVIGLTINKMYTSNPEQDDLIAKLKRIYPNVPIVVGGPEVTLEWETYIKNENINVIVLGEGEKTIIQLLDALAGDIDLKDVHGIVYRDDAGGTIQTPSQEIENIHQIPWPARHLLPMDNYFRLRPSKYYFRKPAATILTSRACPYNCTFCNLKAIWGHRWRGRHPNDVVNEMQYLIDEYGIREILIQDSNFLADPKRAEAICDEILRRQLDISFHVQPGLSIWLLTKPLLKKLKQSGLYTLCAQIETGNTKTLQYIHKKIDFAHAREMIKYANKIGLWTQSNIIIGFPFETKEDIDESIRVAESFHIDKINYVPLEVLHHTRVYDDYLREGLITADKPFTNPVGTHYLTSEEIIELQKKANRHHYVRRILQVISPLSFYTEVFSKINSAEKLRFILRRIFSK